MDAGTNLTALVVWSGFGLAALFGAVAAKTNFCTMGAVSDVVNMGNWGRMRMWLLAMAIAIIGANALHAAGLVDLSKSIYQRPNLTWLSSIVGGLCFARARRSTALPEPEYPARAPSGPTRSGIEAKAIRESWCGRACSAP